MQQKFYVKDNYRKKKNSKNHINYIGDGIYLFNVLTNVIIINKGSFPNFNTARKTDNIHHFSLITLHQSIHIDIVDKEEVGVKKAISVTSEG